MSTRKKNVVITDLSPQFDYGSGAERWNRIRPTVHLCTAAELEIDELYFRVMDGQAALGAQIEADIHQVAPAVSVHMTRSDSTEDIRKLEDFEYFYIQMYEYYAHFHFDYEQNNYFMFIPPGKGGTYTFALLMIIAYLKIECKMMHMKTTLQGTSEHTHVSYLIYDLNLQKWFSVISKHALGKLTALDYLKWNINTRNDKYNALISQLEHVALNSTAPILLAGESGVGKTWLAKRIYDLKFKAKQVTGPFVEVNCGVLRGEGLMSMLFGHVKGAYTGAAATREGLLKTAHNGVLFLDEISEMPVAEQVVLLKALEEKSFMPFGSDKMEFSNFQLICGSNRNLIHEEEKGLFRHDLLARISVWNFTLPPLRERVEDIEPNIEHELQRHMFTAHRKIQFTPEAMQRFLAFATSPEALWKGNLRSLSSCVERLATFSIAGMIGTAMVDEEIARLRKLWSKDTKATEDFLLLKKLCSPEQCEEMDLFDKYQLEGTLNVCVNAQNRSEAGRRLYASSRQKKQRHDDTNRLNAYLKSFGLAWSDIEKLKDLEP